MNMVRIYRDMAGKLMWLALVAVLVRPTVGTAAEQETYPVLQARTQTYTNVTVTSKGKSTILIEHSTGLSKIQVKDLAPDLREKLGYADASQRTKAKSRAAAAWAKQTIDNLETPEMKEQEIRLRQAWNAHSLSEVRDWVSRDPKQALAIGGGLLLLYLFFCNCIRLICQKTGQKPGFLIWLPVLKLFPMLRAAGMSRWWFLGCFVPVFNLLPLITWCFKIAKARAKSLWVGLLLLLPVTTPFAFLYLAFSSGGPALEKKRGGEVLTLEPA
jgi:hypothetical protein